MSVKERPDRPGTYRARVRTPSGKEISRTFERKADAERWERDQRSKMDNNQWIDPRKGLITWDDWAVKVLATRQHLAPGTRADDKANLARAAKYLSGRPLRSIDKTTIEAMVSGLQAAGAAPWTIRSTYKTVHLILDRAVGERILTNPSSGVDLPSGQSVKDMRLLTPGDVDLLADTIGTVRYGKDQKTGKQVVVEVKRPDRRYRALVILAAYSGLRMGELVGLRVADLNLLRRRLTVNRNLVEVDGRFHERRGKTKAARRTISLPKFVCDELAAHLATYGQGPDGEVFTSPTGKTLRANLWRRRVWAPAVERSIGGKCVPHDLRHTHAAWLISQGEHPKAIQTRLGHASIKTTLDTYGHLMEGLDEDLAGRLDDWRAAQTRPKPAETG